MRKYLVLLALVLAGCGGGGGGTTVVNPFNGSWAGPWVNNSVQDSGTMMVTIATNGNMSGTIHSDAFNVDGSISGAADVQGNYTATVTYSGFQPFQTTGTVTFDSQGRLVGNSTQGDAFLLTRL